MSYIPKRPKISIIIPTYKRADFLCTAIESVLSQTYKEIEIIIVDDNTKNDTYQLNTYEKIKHYLNYYEIQYIKHDNNLGAAAARNTGIKKSTGQFIAFLDDDDIWHPRKLEMQIDKLHELQDKNVVIYTGFESINQNSSTKKIFKPYSQGNILNTLLKKNCVGTTSTILINKELLFYIDLFDENLPIRQDYDLYIRLANHFKFYYVQEPLVKFVQHDMHRISNNIYNMHYSNSIIYQKNFELFKENRRMHSIFLYKWGNILHNYNIVDASKYYLKSFFINPLNFKALNKCLISYTNYLIRYISI